MLTLAVFILVLIAVFAIKAVSVMRTHDDLAANAAAFSWASARPEDLARAESWSTEEPQTVDAGVSLGSLRHASGAKA